MRSASAVTVVPQLAVRRSQACDGAVHSSAETHGVPASPYATLIGALKEQAANLDGAIEALDEGTVSRAVMLLLGAKRVFVIGAGASYHVASFIEDSLALYKRVQPAHALEGAS